MDYYNNSSQSNQNEDQDRYSYALQRPGSGTWHTEPQRPPEPPKKKKRNASGIVALLLVGCIIGAGAGGAAGYWAAGLNESPAVTQTQDGTPGQGAQGSQEQSANQSTYTPVAKGSGTELSPAEIFDRCNPAVVAISTETAVRNVFGQISNYASAGSGFIISADGIIVTNHHVIADADTVKVLTADGKTYDAKVIGSDAAVDIAVLSIEATGLPYLTIGDSDSMKVGDMVVAIGNPLGELANTQTVGTVSALGREVNIEGVPMTMLQTDAAISPGNSGGPLINAYGEVIGIVSAKTVDTGVEGIGFAIPANSAMESIGDLQSYGYIKGRPYLGVSLDSSYSSFARQYRLPSGAYIASVEAGSCAEKAGLKEGDVILELGGERIADASALQTTKLKYKAGDTVKIKYLRDSKEYTTDITFDEVKQEETAAAR